MMEGDNNLEMARRNIILRNHRNHQNNGIGAYRNGAAACSAKKLAGIRNQASALKRRQKAHQYGSERNRKAANEKYGNGIAK